MNEPTVTQKLKHWLADNRERHQQLVTAARNDGATFEARMLLPLALLAALMLTIAATGYLVSGYHFAFLPINALSKQIPETVLHLITSFGDGTFLLALMLWLTNRQVRLHWILLLAAVLGALTSNLSKEFFDALRPPAVLEPGSFNLFGKAYHHRSFPSGHTLTAFLLATVAFYFLKSVWQKAAVMVLAVLVGLSRVWLGIHWPMDTLVGGVLGMLCGTLALVIGFRWPAGLNLGTHRFVLLLMTIAAVLLLVDKNDYRLALPMLYLTGILALWTTVRNYLLPARDDSARLLTADTIKVPALQARASAERAFWLVLVLITAYRVLVILQPQFSLFYDEAYYFHWSLNPDLGYYSKPPMVAWVIMVTTALLGNSVLAIKIGATLLYAASAAVLYRTVKRYSCASDGLIAGVVFLTIPMIGFNSEFITTDAPLIFFWTLATAATLRSLETNSLFHWSMVGVFTGLGMLSKYTMGALPLAVFLFLLTHGSHRQKLLTPGPWLAAVVAGLFFSLNIVWNHLNGWVALHHTQEISQTGGELFNIGSLLEFLGAQFFIFGAVASYMLLRTLFARRQPGAIQNHQLPADRVVLLYWITGVILVGISVQAFLSRAFPNWAGPWVVGGTLLLAFTWRTAFSAEKAYRLLIYNGLANLILLSMFYHLPQLYRWLDIEPTRRNDPFHRVLGWPQLGEQLQPILARYPEARLTSDSRDLIAYLGYYGAPGSFYFARWNPNANNIRDYYDLELNLRQWAGEEQQGYIFVSHQPLTASMLDRFEEAYPLGELRYDVYSDQKMSVQVTFARGFKGYLTMPGVLSTTGSVPTP